ncbi:peptide-methionine (S)-S-oxide reductase MsrA [Paracoccus shanxieyensis]|uniref:Peptide methionine sulfoxide reductase MsrA n=1 Tax=Paracoccus shanxieyensis TaxID=2675752 RepID=A0A6L6ITS6_9RHOB|nr:peptide-methionine (S)-S-oxide reductase MsrA [Paracoccus shanxieyensis]MTH62752.1 peptide-methionine (S)-S-oxide reductase MsrA [Paracoccus shanxieyensis]MTH86164.1 peptide-methionine (S)-S-oxide reductase MsrA [Paracoccus shanxieyensis]
MSTVMHRIFDRPMDEAAPKGFETVIFGMGCYWGVERLFWQLDGVWMTEVGFAGGHVENPSYKQVCEGSTGHAEVVRVVFDPSRISFERLLQVFWENHNPTQGNRQGNDVGSQYRSVIMYTTQHQKNAAELSKADYGNRLAVEGFKAITTEIVPATPFYPAHEDHQQYLDRYPDGYCGLRGTGVQAPLTDIAEEI